MDIPMCGYAMFYLFACQLMLIQGCFYLLVLPSNASMNIHIQVFVFEKTSMNIHIQVFVFEKTSMNIHIQVFVYVPFCIPTTSL
jgi:hypothetical protein